MKRIVLALIHLYQATYPLHMGLVERLTGSANTCRFTPTCSAYMTEAVEKYGAAKGVGMGLKRIGRCHPWTAGGYDPVK